MTVSPSANFMVLSIWLSTSSAMYVVTCEDESMFSDPNMFSGEERYTLSGYVQKLACDCAKNRSRSAFCAAGDQVGRLPPFGLVKRELLSKSAKARTKWLRSSGNPHLQPENEAAEPFRCRHCSKQLSRVGGGPAGAAQNADT